MLVIDGHNLIGSGLLPGISLSDPDDEQRLIAMLRNFRAHHPDEAVQVVFDPGREGGLAGAKHEGGITVSFAPRGSTADAVIMKTLRRAANPRRLTVVSSDNAVRSAARAEGAQVVSAQEFAVRLIARPRKRGGIRQGDKPELNAADVDYWLERFKQRR